ncbi:hypothetical protein GP486_005857 [Trichoglossum hirsutum]|uniref:Uncharacterized protein n=1 Tax=Trichoglossum hirsutum TaxID=265104 RepID=A0A9P8L8E8_9PEZI|nr:hypothetical protein GP486_005857 [Trichoglossum hirsutum]
MPTEIPSSVEEFIKKHPGWKSEGLKVHATRTAGFDASTSDWGLHQVTAYRVLRNGNLPVENVLPNYQPSKLHNEGSAAVREALAGKTIADAKIEKYPSYELKSLGGRMGDFYVLLAKVLERVPVIAGEASETKVQPPRAAKTHRRTCSIESVDSIAASRDSDLNDHYLRLKSEKVTGTMLWLFLHNVTSLYYTKMEPKPNILPELDHCDKKIKFSIAESGKTCSSINDGNYVAMGLNQAGHWNMKMDLPCAVEVKRGYSIGKGNDDSETLVKNFRVLAQEAGEMVALAHAWVDNGGGKPFTVYLITAAQQRMFICSALVTSTYQEYIQDGDSTYDIRDAHLMIKETRPFNLAVGKDRVAAAEAILFIVEELREILDKSQ